MGGRAGQEEEAQEEAELGPEEVEGPHGGSQPPYTPPTGADGPISGGLPLQGHPAARELSES